MNPQPGAKPPKGAVAKKPGAKGRDGALEKRSPAEQAQFEKEHPRAPKGRTGGGSWVQKGEGMDGEPSPRVAHLQDRLTNLGYPVGAVDGRFGDTTDAAVKQFQSSHKLKPDGQVGADTAVALRGTTPQDSARRLEKAKEGYGKLEQEKWHVPTPEELAADKKKASAAKASSGSGGASASAAGGASQTGERSSGGASAAKGAGAPLRGQKAGSLDVNDKNAVEAFQRGHGLQVDGVVGPETRAAMKESGTSTLGQARKKAGKPGGSKSRGKKRAPGKDMRKGEGIGTPRGVADVREMQKVLDSLGYSLGEAGVDGRFGPDTEKAVKKLQRRFGLHADGVFGQKTRRLVTRLAKRAVKAAARSKNNPRAVLDALQSVQVDELRLPQLVELLEAHDYSMFTEAGMTRTLDLLEAARDERVSAWQEGDKARYWRALARERLLRDRLAQESLTEAVGGRGASATRGAVRDIMRLPDGTFAPKGLGRVLSSQERRKFTNLVRREQETQRDKERTRPTVPAGMQRVSPAAYERNARHKRASGAASHATRIRERYEAELRAKHAADAKPKRKQSDADRAVAATLGIPQSPGESPRQAAQREKKDKAAFMRMSGPQQKAFLAARKKGASRDEAFKIARGGPKPPQSPGSGDKTDFGMFSPEGNRDVKDALDRLATGGKVDWKDATAALAKLGGEATDTAVREEAWDYLKGKGLLSDGDLKQYGTPDQSWKTKGKPQVKKPSGAPAHGGEDFGMFSPEGNQKVRRALDGLGSKDVAWPDALKALDGVGGEAGDTAVRDEAWAYLVDSGRLRKADVAKYATNADATMARHGIGQGTSPVPQSPGSGGFTANGKGGTSVKDMPVGQHFKLKNGDEYVVHKHADNGGVIGKPVGGGKAKFFNGMLAPAEVGPVVAQAKVAVPKTKGLNLKNLGPGGQPRNVHAMGVTKLKELSAHPDVDPELKKRVDARLVELGKQPLGDVGGVTPYAKRVKELEAEGLTTSDAQSAADTEASVKAVAAKPDAPNVQKDVDKAVADLVAAGNELADNGHSMETAAAWNDAVEKLKDVGGDDHALDSLIDAGYELADNGHSIAGADAWHATYSQLTGTAPKEKESGKPLPAPFTSSKPLNLKNTGPSGKERNVHAMSDAKLTALLQHPSTEPALRTRVSQELSKRGFAVHHTGTPTPKLPALSSEDQSVAAAAAIEKLPGVQKLDSPVEVKKLHFTRKPYAVPEPDSFGNEKAVVTHRVTLPQAEWDKFRTSPVVHPGGGVYHDSSMASDGYSFLAGMGGAGHSVYVSGPTGKDGVIVNPEGSNYGRYVSPLPEGVHDPFVEMSADAMTLSAMVDQSADGGNQHLAAIQKLVEKDPKLLDSLTPLQRSNLATTAVDWNYHALAGKADPSQLYTAKSKNEAIGYAEGQGPGGGFMFDGEAYDIVSSSPGGKGLGGGPSSVTVKNRATGKQETWTFPEEGGTGLGAGKAAGTPKTPSKPPVSGGSTKLAAAIAALAKKKAELAAVDPSDKALRSKKAAQVRAAKFRVKKAGGDPNAPTPDAPAKAAPATPAPEKAAPQADQYPNLNPEDVEKGLTMASGYQQLLDFGAELEAETGQEGALAWFDGTPDTKVNRRKLLTELNRLAGELVDPPSEKPDLPDANALKPEDKDLVGKQVQWKPFMSDSMVGGTVTSVEPGMLTVNVAGSDGSPHQLDLTKVGDSVDDGGIEVLPSQVDLSSVAGMPPEQMVAVLAGQMGGDKKAAAWKLFDGGFISKEQLGMLTGVGTQYTDMSVEKLNELHAEVLQQLATPGLSDYDRSQALAKASLIMNAVMAKAGA